MRHLLISIAVTSFSLALSAQCDGNRYRNFVFEGHTVTSNIQYGQNVNYANQNVNLMLDVYEPAGDTQVDRPLVIFVHGGSFVGGSKTGADVVPLIQDVVRMGYVVASISYRLGLEGTPLFPNETTATEGVIRGYHDFKAAVRWFRKNVVEEGNEFDIDPEEIYAVGVSAGGFVVLHSAYLDEVDEFPDYDTTDPGLQGELEGTSGNAGYSSEVKGIVNVAGALADTAWIHAGDEPVLLLHGTNDGTVPFDFEMLYFLGSIAIVEVAGSNAIAQRAEEQELTYCFEIHEGQGHVPHVGGGAYYDTTLSLTANFISHLVCPQIVLDCDYREIETIVGTEELVESQELTFFPNPVKDRLTVRFPGMGGINSVKVFDAFGREVLNQSGFVRTDFILDTGSLRPGVYRFVVTQSDGRSAMASFVRD